MSNRPARVSPESTGAPPPDPRDFLAGARVSFTSPILVSFAFSDDVWYLLDRLPKGVSPHRTRMNFGLFPGWLRDSMKRYVAHLWLERRVSLGACQALIESTTRFVEALAEGDDPFPGPVERLTRFHGQRFSAYLERRVRIGQEVKARMEGRPRVEVHRAMAEARGLSGGTAFNSARRLNQFGAWLRADPQRMDTDFAVPLTRILAEAARRRGLGAAPDKVITDDVLTAVLAACDEELVAFERAEAELAAAQEAIEHAPSLEARRHLALTTNRFRGARSRATKAQAVRLQMLAARRRAAIVSLPLDPPVRMTHVDGQRVLHILFTSYKQYGDAGSPEWVPFPGFMGDVAMDALATAQRLTADLREHARPEDRTALFLVRNREPTHQNGRRNGVRVRVPTGKVLAEPLTGRALQEYLNSQAQHNPGLVQRYGITAAVEIATHHARHTNATRIVENGGSVVLAAQYLGHSMSEGDPLMAKLFYIAGGTPDMQERMVRALDAGAATGRRFDAIARVATALVGGAAAEADVPPNQLTPEDAMRRIREANIVVPEQRTPDQIRGALMQGLAIGPTLYGGCTLQATSGPCPTAEQCPIGLHPDAPGVEDGEGCEYQVLMPHGRDYLAEEVELMEIQLEFFAGRPEYWFWRARLERRLRVWRRQIERCDALPTVGDAR